LCFSALEKPMCTKVPFLVSFLGFFAFKSLSVETVRKTNPISNIFKRHGMGFGEQGQRGVKRDQIC
jgi:hypothetical protein